VVDAVVLVTLASASVVGTVVGGVVGGSVVVVLGSVVVGAKVVVVRGMVLVVRSGATFGADVTEVLTGTVVTRAAAAVVGGAAVVVGAGTVVVGAGAVVVGAGAVVVVVGSVVVVVVVVVGSVVVVGTVTVVRLALSADCSKEFWALSALTCLDRDAMAAASLLGPAARGTVVGVWPSWDWITWAAELIRCWALAGFLAESALLASFSCSLARTNFAARSVRGGPDWLNELLITPPPTAPTNNVMTAATSKRARLRRRTARTADAVALI
jgi:hypothetical protein